MRHWAQHIFYASFLTEGKKIMKLTLESFSYQFYWNKDAQQQGRRLGLVV